MTLLSTASATLAVMAMLVQNVEPTHPGAIICTAGEKTLYLTTVMAKMTIPSY